MCCVRDELPLAIQAHTLEQALGLTPAEPAQPGAVQRRAALLRLQRSNQQLINLTHQLLVLAQAEQPAAQATVTADLQALCLQALEDYAPAAERKSIDLGWHGPDAAETDNCILQAATPLLPELLANLLDNAIRYTPPHGRVTLGLETTATTLTLWVEDNGPGIPAQSHTRVFERFYRLANDTQGTGLGLAIVQEVARSCGATLALGPAQHMPGTQERPGLRVNVQFPRPS